jgi:hypothetical protein
VDHAVAAQPLLDRTQRREHAVVVGRDESHERQQQHRAVEVVGAEGAGERADLLMPRLAQHRLADPIGLSMPALDPVAGLQQVSQVDGPVERHPAHHLAGGVLPSPVPRLPHAGVGLLPRGRGLLGQPQQQSPCGLVDGLELLPVAQRHVQHLTHHVQLRLAPRGVADAHGGAARVAVQVGQL